MLALPATESAIMLCQSGSTLMSTFAPSSFRAMNTGTGGIAHKLGVVTAHQVITTLVEYMMEWSIMPNLGPKDVPGAYAGVDRSTGTAHLGDASRYCHQPDELRFQIKDGFL